MRTAANGRERDAWIQGRLLRWQSVIRIDQPRARVRSLTGARGPGFHRDRDQQPAPLQPRLRRPLPARGDRAEGGDCTLRRCLVRDPGVQPVHPRLSRTPSTGHLGRGARTPSTHPRRRHRGIDRPIGTAVAQQSLRAVLSFCNARQMTSPEAYPILPGGVRGQRRGDQRRDRDIPAPLHDRVPRLRGAGLDRPPAPSRP